MDIKKSENISQKNQPVIIPPEPTKPPEVPLEFGSPALFQKDNVKETRSEVIPEISVTEEKSNRLSTKVVFAVIGAFLIVLVGVISIVQISISNQFVSPVTEESNNESEDIDSPDITVITNGGNINQPSQEDVMSLCPSGPSVSIVSPKEGEIFTIGDIMSIDIELCDISPSLFTRAFLEYRDPENLNKNGRIELSCAVMPQTMSQSKQNITWQIPPFFEIETPRPGCLLPTVNFLNEYEYQIYVEYARGLYSATSGIFFINSENYTYIPPRFSEYQIDPEINFPRAEDIDVSAPSFLQEIISPVYFQSPALFANFYRLYVIPRGPSYIIDLRDGKAHPSPSTSGQVYVRPLSNLYISQNPLESLERPQTGQTHVVRWYLFDELSKNFDIIVERLCSIQSGTIDPVYQNCIPIID